MRRIWKHALHNLPKGTDRDGKIDELQKVFRDGRTYIFQDPAMKSRKYPCGFGGRKFWRTEVSYVLSWAASKPDWYTF